VLRLIGARDRRHIIHLTVLVWFLFCIACVFAAIAELRKPVPIKDDGKDSGE